MRKFTQYIKESDEYPELKEEVREMIENTIENSGGEFNQFVESFIKNPEDFKIEGLINDSDIYDFYLKWRNEIDEILNNINFFDQTPVDNNAFGVYEYIIVATERSILEIVKSINE